MIAEYAPNKSIEASNDVPNLRVLLHTAFPSRLSLLGSTLQAFPIFVEARVVKKLLFTFGCNRCYRRLSDPLYVYGCLLITNQTGEVCCIIDEAFNGTRAKPTSMSGGVSQVPCRAEEILELLHLIIVSKRIPQNRAWVPSVLLPLLKLPFFRLNLAIDPADRMRKLEQCLFQQFLGPAEQLVEGSG